jgi:hypothetical protein
LQAAPIAVLIQPWERKRRLSAIAASAKPITISGGCMLVYGAVDGKQLMPDDNRDLCEICWSPLQTLMKKVHEEAREKRNSSSGA